LGSFAVWASSIPQEVIVLLTKGIVAEGSEQKALRGRGLATKGKRPWGIMMDLGCEVEQAPRTIQPLQARIIGSLANAFYNPEEGVLCFAIHRAMALTDCPGQAPFDFRDRAMA
jgi:hypothetical protein